MNKVQHKTLFFCSNPYNGGIIKVFKTVVDNWDEENFVVGVNEDNECFKDEINNSSFWFVPKKSNYDLTKNYSYPVGKIIRMISYLWYANDILFFKKELKKRGFDSVYSFSGGYIGSDELALKIAIGAKSAGIKNIILSIHNYPKSRKNIISRFLYGLFDKIISWSCSSIVTVSKDCADSLNNICKFTKKVDYIYNGLDNVVNIKSLDEKKTVLGVQDGEKIVGMIGGLEERKGHKYAILAMKKIVEEIPGSKLIVIGDDFEQIKDELESLVKDNSLEDHVLFTGYLDNAPEYFECFDVAVIPSICFENLPVVSLEAMYYEKPIIGTNVGGIPEIIVDGETGFIVPPKNESLLAEKIIYLLSNPKKASQMGKNGKKRLETVFSVNNMVEQYLKIAN